MTRLRGRLGGVAALALSAGALWAPRIALSVGAPVMIAGCQCAERGVPVVLDEATVAREPAVSVSGVACEPADVVCMHRGSGDRCDVFWIEPKREGLCVFSVRFPDGTAIDRVIDFDEDGEYPCRGNVRPRTDQVTRIDSETSSRSRPRD